MRIIVTGASGFVGAALIPHLAAGLHEGIAVARQKIENLPAKWTFASPGQLIRSNHSAEWLIHLEVKQHVQNPGSADIEEFKRVNVERTRDWLSWSTRNGIKRFLYFSTVKAVQAPEDGSPADESAPGPGNTPYGMSKWEAEQSVLRWAEEDASRTAIIARPAVVYGPGNQANMFAMLDAIARKRFFLVGRAENVKSLLSLRNLKHAVSHLLWVCPSGSHIFNIVDERSYSVRRLAAMMANALGVSPPPTLPCPAARIVARAGDVLARAGFRTFPVTTSRLRALLENTNFTPDNLICTGFKHSQTTEEGIRELAIWYLREGRQGHA